MQTQKHKIDKKLLSFLPILLTLLLPLFLSYATTTYISDTFEANPWTGDQFWTSVSDVGTTAAAKYAGTYSAAVNASLPIQGILTFEFGETIPENLTYTAYARSTDTATSGIEIRLQVDIVEVGTHNYYVGNINHTKDFNLESTAEAFWLITQYNGADYIIYNTTLSVVTTRWTKLEIRFDNSTNRVNCYINGTHLRAYAEIGVPYAIYANFDEYGTTAYLDNVNVQDQAAPTGITNPTTLLLWNLIPLCATIVVAYSFIADLRGGNIDPKRLVMYSIGLIFIGLVFSVGLAQWD